MSTNRLEAFSDGVIAIAITLLVLEIGVPETEEGGLAQALADQWPSYAAYAVSFTVIGIMWMNHHAIFDRVAVVDRPLLVLNLHLLLWIALLPWPTALLAEHVDSGGGDAGIAAAVYSATMFMCAIAFTVLWRWVVRDDGPLDPAVDRATAQASTRRFGLGLLVYLAAIGLSFVSAPATLALHAAAAVYYLWDQLAVAQPAGR